jgi:hypothetical protein
METLTIESKETFSMGTLAGVLSRHWRVENSPGETLVVHGDRGRAYLHAENEAEPDGSSRLLLDYSDIDLARRLLALIANDPTLMVDNDFGTVLPGDDFVALCQADKVWDWRR